MSLRPVAAGAVATALVLAGCSAAEGDSEPNPSASIAPKPTPTASTAGNSLDAIVDLGAAQKRVDITRLNGGDIRKVTGPDGRTWLRFPPFRSGSSPPGAAVAIWPRGGQMSPGDRDFSYGADFRLDAESSGSSTDNGDNVLQRGLFSGDAQFKIQIDRGLASCRVKGGDGALLVKADKPVDPTTWYRVRCVRDGDELRMELGRYVDGGVVGAKTYTATGPLGHVSFPTKVPLSIGGKLTGSGDLTASSTDQFNGWIGNVYVHVH